MRKCTREVQTCKIKLNESNLLDPGSKGYEGTLYAVRPRHSWEGEQMRSQDRKCRNAPRVSLNSILYDLILSQWGICRHKSWKEKVAFKCCVLCCVPVDPPDSSSCAHTRAPQLKLTVRQFCPHASSKHLIWNSRVQMKTYLEELGRLRV